MSGIKNDFTKDIKLPIGVAVIWFMNKGSAKNSVEVSDSGKKISKVYTHKENSFSYVDILKNEGPLFFFYDFDENVSNFTTTEIPASEGEIRFSA